MDISEAAVGALGGAWRGGSGLKPVLVEARDLSRRPFSAEELAGCDAAVIDPPRAGASHQHQALAHARLERVAGVSCNPATFARDAKILIDGGFKLERVLPVDQFLWSPHIELVGVFARRG